MEMQDQGAIENALYDEVHEVDNANEQQDYTGPVTRSRAKAQDQVDSSANEESPIDHDGEIHVPREGLPILVHVERFEGGPVLSTLLQDELIAEIINGCVQEYPVTVDTLNEFEFVIAMPKDMIASIVAQDLQNMTHWGEYMLTSSAPLLLKVS